MKIELLVSTGNVIQEISELVTGISWSDKLNDGCSKLELTLVNDTVSIGNASVIQFKYDDNKVFRGFVFRHSKNDKGEITVTAYDKLRYCKAKDSIVVKNNTVSDVVKSMCGRLSLRPGTIVDSKYKLPLSVQDSKTWLDIVYEGIRETTRNIGEWYVLRDEFGDIALKNISELKLNLVLGDNSLCYGFDYEKSIDQDFYNHIKIYIKNEDVKKSKFISQGSDESINKYGILQYFEVSDKNYNEAQANAKALELLKLYNRESETLDMDCLGDMSVRAGSSFYASIEDIKLKQKRLIVRSVTHKFLPIHTMSLEVMI